MLSNCCLYDLEDFIKGRKALRLCGRKSPLSIVQMSEIETIIKTRYPLMYFEKITVDTSGDFDRTTSITNLTKSDFFTDAVDQAVLNRRCDIGIHSAKDLPHFLPQGLSLIAVTDTIHPGDSLVYHPDLNLDALPKCLTIGTSSVNRKTVICSLFPEYEIRDIRGNIEERLEQLYAGRFDGLVIAEAALMRLKIKIKNKISLPPPYTPFQGSLAITSKDNAEAIRIIVTSVIKESSSHPLLIDIKK